jgi:hypothetical protein
VISFSGPTPALWRLPFSLTKWGWKTGQCGLDFLLDRGTRSSGIDTEATEPHHVPMCLGFHRPAERLAILIPPLRRSTGPSGEGALSVFGPTAAPAPDPPGPPHPTHTQCTSWPQDASAAPWAPPPQGSPPPLSQPRLFSVCRWTRPLTDIPDAGQFRVPLLRRFPAASGLASATASRFLPGGSGSSHADPVQLTVLCTAVGH